MAIALMRGGLPCARPAGFRHGVLPTIQARGREHRVQGERRPTSLYVYFKGLGLRWRPFCPVRGAPLHRGALSGAAAAANGEASGRGTPSYLKHHRHAA
jgi:hypothetical protein